MLMAVTQKLWLTIALKLDVMYMRSLGVCHSNSQNLPWPCEFPLACLSWQMMSHIGMRIPHDSAGPASKQKKFRDSESLLQA